MLRSKFMPATIAVVLALGAGGTAFAGESDGENGQEIAAVLGAKASIAQAVAAAEQQTGGRAMKADVESEKGAYVYEIKIVSNGRVSDVFVDTASGKVLRADARGLIARLFDWEDQGEFDKLLASPVTLPAAIATAEQQTGGKALQARFGDEDGNLLFTVETVRDNAVQRVEINSATGKVVKVAAAQDGDRDGD